MRNTSIRTRKMRGVDSFVTLMSAAVPGDGAFAMADLQSLSVEHVGHQYGTAAAGRKADVG
jgi:hypothetical protein